MSTRFVQALAAVLFVGALGLEARADSKVDWSQFIEKPGDRTIVNKPAVVAQAPKAAKPARTAKPVKKRAAKSKQKR
ncbi:hypothetical protein BH11MYX1_BH11MYX1_56720 [soil metagenome]